ncbi:MAG: hypothetical protein LC649_07950 [Bacteroidales bacterium]|nr:hypothetical protein [Bacteroidales bacterium]
MKKLLWFKLLVVLPLIIMADYLIMAFVGCTTCLFGLGDDFYCGPFCLAGKILLLLSAGLFFFYIFPDIRALLKKEENGKTA